MSKTKNVELLSSLIKQSDVIGDFEKEEFLRLLPEMNDEQADELEKFLVSAKTEIDTIKSGYDQKKGALFAAFTPELEQAFTAAHKAVFKTKESINQKKEENTQVTLLEELKNA